MKKVDVKEVITRFEIRTPKLRKKSTQPRYAHEFERFARTVGLGAFNRRQLAGDKGEALIRDYLNGVPKPSRRVYAACLKRVWTRGLDLAWPEGIKDEVEFSKVRARTTPPDELVRPWFEALQHDVDVYARLLFWIPAELGWRPGHIGGVNVEEVKRDTNGAIYAIVADGRDRSDAARFKTDSPVVAYTTPELARLLEAWLKRHPDPRPGKPLLPWRNASGGFNTDQRLNDERIAVHWERLRRKWGLRKNRLTRCDLRHWVATKCREAGMTGRARASLMGHDPMEDGSKDFDLRQNFSMGDWYDNPEVSKIVDEQRSKLGDGLLARTFGAKVTLVDGPTLSNEESRLVFDFKAGRITAFDLAQRLDALRIKANAEVAKA